MPNDPERAAEIAVQIAPQIELLEAVLSDGEYALGGFTIADCAIAPVLFRTTKSGLDLTAYPKLSRLRDDAAGASVVRRRGAGHVAGAVVASARAQGSARPGRLAQLVRAPALQAGGRGFEALTAHRLHH